MERKVGDKKRDGGNGREKVRGCRIFIDTFFPGEDVSLYS